MKIIFVAPKYNYGDPQKGYSFEYHNFWPVLKKRGIYFSIDQELRKYGRKKLNCHLLSLVNREKPDLVFFVLFTDEIKKKTIKKISQQTKTLNWFCDDNWRYNNFSRFYASDFTRVATTYSSALKQFKNGIKTQWAANELVYKPQPGPEYGVTFVGQAHSNRKKLINYLEKKGINVERWGEGWPNGRIKQDKMIEIFSNSKINLNFAQSSFSNYKFLAKKLFFKRLDKTSHWQKRFDLNWPGKQIKARNFEIPACAGFLLSEQVEGLEDYYQPDREAAFFLNKKDLVKKIKYYLVADKRRKTIAQAGYERTIKDHTYKHRFNEIFRAMRLPDRV